VASQKLKIPLFYKIKQERNLSSAYRSIFILVAIT